MIGRSPRRVWGVRFVGLSILAGLTIIGNVQAKVVTAATPALQDVAKAVAAAAEGDTVMVPAGTASWTSPLSITKGITLQGATTIGGSPSRPVVADQTIILDEIPRVPHGEARPNQQQGPGRQRRGNFQGQGHGGWKQWSSIVIIDLKSHQVFRMTGFTFRKGSQATKVNNGGVRIHGRCPSVRIDHCHFDQMLFCPFIEVRGEITGVVDHCVLDGSPHCECFQVYHDAWGGNTNGNGSWADATSFGSEKFLFIENNTFRKSGDFGSGFDCYGGERYVARFNVFNDTALTSHGTETTGRIRGTRAVEIYNNVFNWTLRAPRPGQLRSGTLLEFNNTWTGKPAIEHANELSCYREFWPFRFWGAANGNNRLDLNDPHGLYASGKHTGPNNSDTLVVADAGWKGGQWVGYSVTNITQTLPNGFHPSSFITANTSDSITFERSSDYGPVMNFNSGDNFAIYRVIAALDQPGRGKGDLINDKNPAETASWPHQALEPCYAWGNTYNHTRQLDLGSPYPTIQANRDYYNQKTPFDGTAGVGVGKLADRPKSCTPGVAYWATDQGKWNTADNGSNGQLYVCSAPDTWSLYYKPFTYPHSLVKGAAAAVSNKRESGWESSGQ
jgi:hypothetical protein